MKSLLLLLVFGLAAPAAANPVVPDFTQGTMNSTTTTTIDISRTIETEKYGAAVSTWSGSNVTASGDISNTATTYSIHTAGDPWTLEITTRAAGLIEDTTITETIDQTSTITTLSVFSQ